MSAVAECETVDDQQLLVTAVRILLAGVGFPSEVRLITTWADGEHTVVDCWNHGYRLRTASIEQFFSRDGLISVARVLDWAESNPPD